MAAWRRPVEAFRKWWSRQSASERWRIAATLVALALLLLVIAFALWRTTALTALLLAPVAVCLVVLGLLGPNAREWLIEHVIPIGALLLSGWLLGAFGLWAVVNTVWAGQAQHPAQDHALLTVAGVPLTAAADYPAVALAGAADDVLTLSFSAGATPLPRQVVTATVTLPATLAFATAGGPPTRDFLVPLTAGQPGSRRIGIVNNGVYGGWRGRQETIAVRLCAGKDNCTTDDLSLTVRPEGRDGYAIRRFVNSTIDQSSPIILLLLFVVPGLAIWGQRVLNDQRTELQKRRADECDQMIANFRSYLCAPQMERAATALNELQKTRFRGLKEFERNLATQLYQLATLNYPQNDPFPHEWPDLWIIRSGPEWPREFVMAGLIAQDRLGTLELEAAYNKRFDTPEEPFNFEAYVGPRLRAFLYKIWDVLRRIPLAPDDDLFVRRERMDEQRREYYARQRPVLQVVPRSYTIPRRRNRLATPFALGDANRAEERRFLVDGQAFWGNHPLLGELRNGDHSLIVSGTPGSGRTALATMLPMAYINDPADLFVRVEAGAPRQEIVNAIAEQLLSFVLRQPAFLGRRTPDQQQKLAHFLATWLDSDALRTPINSRLAELQQISASATEAEQQYKNRAAHDALELFKQRLPATGDERAALDTDNWTSAFLENVHLLEFWNVVFVITLRSPSHLEWLERLGRFKTFYDRRVHFWLFVDDNDVVRDNITIILDEVPDVVYDLRLAWEEQHRSAFRAMLDWRYEKYLDAVNLVPRRERRRALGTCFDDEDDLERLIAASLANGEYNPRRFMRLWRAAAGDKVVGDTITSADVDLALAGDRAPAGGGNP